MLPVISNYNWPDHNPRLFALRYCSAVKSRQCRILAGLGKAPGTSIKPEAKKGFEFGADGKKVQNKSWSMMLSRVFKIDVLKCDCGGELKPLGAVQDPAEVRRYLKHCNIEYDPPPRGPPKLVQNSFEFDQTPPLDEYEAAVYID